MTASELLVFDLKRFAVHDGSGIRTTVFLKGCPLRCRWCQNPEGLMKERGIIWFKDKCIGCGLCHQTCPSLPSFGTSNRYIPDQPGFEAAVSICPSTALRYDSEWIAVPDLLARIKEDMVFFQQGGGVTFSGGEPLMQADGLKEILQACRREGIHTCMETSLSAPPEKVQGVLPYLDEMYCDMKLFDEQRHREMTGVSNALIKKNIRMVLSSDLKDQVTVRTPLIPGCTADDENLFQISSFLVQCNPDVHYELLNYNPLAPAKYDLTPFAYGVKADAKPYSKAEMSHFYSVIRKAGIRHPVLAES
jgi:pyruvate formate lyase activating enzyme